MTLTAAVVCLALGLVPAEYRAEFHYAGAFVALAEGALPRAEEAVHAGLKVARRASTERNGLFLLAQLAERAGHVEEALRLYASGAAHRFKGQGGDALLAWGDLLAQGRDDAQARRAWALAVARDPESPAAVIARQRLGATARTSI